jgi:flavin-binding protein dodecin
VKAGVVRQTSSREETMTYGKNRIYKKVEVIGVSQAGLEAAIQAALGKAHQSLEKLSWFEVEEIHGHIGEDGRVSEYQVLLKVAFELK